MFTYKAIKKYQAHREKKKAEEAGIAPADANAPANLSNAAPRCQQCGETSKIDFMKREEAGQQVTWATCGKCGAQQRHR